MLTKEGGWNPQRAGGCKKRDLVAVSEARGRHLEGIDGGLCSLFTGGGKA